MVALVPQQLAPVGEVTDEEVDAWRVAVDAAGLIQGYFPAFYAEHLRSRPATLPGGLGAACAFFRLVEVERNLELRWPGTNTWDRGFSLKDEMGSLSPEEWLTVFDGVSEEYLGSFGYWLFQPRPVYHGWNVQTLLGGEAGAPGQLTALLWQLVSETALSIGRPNAIQQACAQRDEDDRWDVLRIPPVVPCDVDALLRLVAATIPEAHSFADPAALLRYPLGATGNPLADTGDVDLEVVHEGDDIEAWSWAQLDTLAAQQQQARELGEAFAAWRDRVERGGLAALRAVARDFHRAARQIGNEPKTLIAILTREEAEVMR